MTNYKNGNGFVDNATAKRIADMKALEVSKSDDASRSALRSLHKVREWVGEGPLQETKGSWEFQGTYPPQEMISHMPLGGGRVLVTLARQNTFVQQGHWEFFGGSFRSETFVRTWTNAEFTNVEGTVFVSGETGEITTIYSLPNN
jgi:hypothetical protein